MIPLRWTLPERGVAGEGPAGRRTRQERAQRDPRGA